ncbi:hypothetical protein COF46_11850 [Bacillus pseudomycoides]|nr:hypothetical protein COF46_11850 [Bacillus pseudomycoides]
MRLREIKLFSKIMKINKIITDYDKIVKLESCISKVLTKLLGGINFIFFMEGFYNVQTCY